MSSFSHQYGIRLEKEEDTITYSEYRKHLIGINGDTPLGYVVQIRAETDNEKIQKMTKHEKEIRQKWFEFKHRQNKENSKQIVSNFQQMLKSMFNKG